jgi:hypothetical protein
MKLSGNCRNAHNQQEKIQRIQRPAQKRCQKRMALRTGEAAKMLSDKHTPEHTRPILIAKNFLPKRIFVATTILPAHPYTRKSRKATHASLAFLAFTDLATAFPAAPA